MIPWQKPAFLLRALRFCLIGLSFSMGAIYLRYTDGQVTQRSEEEVRSLWAQGLVPRETIYWRNGMADWQALVDWLGHPPESASIELAEETGRYHFLIDPGGLTKLLQNLLWVGVGLGCLALLLDLTVFARVEFGLVSPDQTKTEDTLQAILGFFQLVVGLSAGIAFFKWTYRAYKNIQEFGAEGLKYSPGWAVGYYFIPILCLFRPVQVMSEIWRASEDPVGWSKRKSSRLVAIWWTLCLLYSFVTQASLQIGVEVTNMTQWTWSFVIAILSDLLAIGVAVAVMRLVTRIYDQQRRLVERPEGAEA